ncbi:hypothetical protein KP509_32G026400 [Ceratopteris richardii]|uniref:Trypsin family protein n=1 Tax=Ceratopteris richardii TaxID=49495 RepID=A0A8T2QU29_CERRI|nr:hypothetical protein KP509_32G026400 [Ceratopteris richardii]
MSSPPAADDTCISRRDITAAQDSVNFDTSLSHPLKRPLSECVEREYRITEATDSPGAAHCSSDGSGLDRDLSLSASNSNRPTQADSPSLQLLASNPHHSENNATYFLWPASYNLHGVAGSRTAFFYGLQKDAGVDISERTPTGTQAATLLDLMTIRAFHSKRLRHVSLATAVGFRTRQGILTNIPAIIVFVARKVHKAWLEEGKRLPVYLEGPGGIWCDVDVVEFLYYGVPAVTPKEQVYTELVEGLRGNDPCIGPGSQVASHETYGTLGAIVQSRTGAQQVGFLTSRHVAVDLDYPNQKMFHPLPPNVGQGVFLGAVERATSFITDDRWYNIFASMNPETFVHADGAFIPFGDSFDMSRVTTMVRGIGGMGDVALIGLQDPISSIVGKQVIKVGRSSGLTKGRIMAYALENNDEKGICFFTDFLIVGEDNQPFDLEGDSGSLILMVEDGKTQLKPFGIIWGGTANRGRLKLRSGHAPENWTSGVDLGRLLECLQLDLITSDIALQEAIRRQTRVACGASREGDCYSQHAGSVDHHHALAFVSSRVNLHADQAAQGEGSFHENQRCMLGDLDANLVNSHRPFFSAVRETTQHADSILSPQRAESQNHCFDLNVSSNDTDLRWL